MGANACVSLCTVEDQGKRLSMKDFEKMYEHMTTGCHKKANFRPTKFPGPADLIFSQ